MNSILLTILTLSVSGSVIAVLLLAITPLIKNRVSKISLYYLWLVVLLRLAIPSAAPEVNLMGALINDWASQPQTQVVQQPAIDTEQKPQTDNESVGDPSPVAANKPSVLIPQAEHTDSVVNTASDFDLLDVLTKNLLWIWLAGAAVCLGWYIFAYAVFTQKLKKSLRQPNAADAAVFDGMRGKRHVRLAYSSIVVTPMLIGILRPIIVVPQLAYVRNGMEDVFKVILRHELVHDHRKDVIYKWICVAVTSAHWFNPLMFFVRKEIGKACELACDETVIRTMTSKETQAYGNILLALSSSKRLPSGVLATTLCEGKKELKERLTSIMKYKQKTIGTTVLSVALAIMLTGCGAALGTVVEDKTAEDLSPVITEKQQDVDVTNLVGEGKTNITDISNNDEAQESEVLATTEQEPIDKTWRSKFPNKFGETESTESSYKSNNINVSVERFQQDDVTYYVADIYIAEMKYLQTALSGGEFNGKNEWQLDLAKEKKAVVSVSGDYYSVNAEGVVVRNSVLYRSEPLDDVCVLNNDGTTETFSQEDFDIETVKANGAWQIWSFGPMLLTDGKAVDEFNSPVAQKHPRAAIGYYEPGHYCFVVVDGRQQDYSLGMTLQELSKLFESLGCKTAYNLHGGQSAAMTFGDSLASQPYNGGRQISDIVYIGEE